ncbi:BppU family phage baseplate upper protein, partial [Tetragenococcus koreensis]|uniref:BppU family phage baseplate upper protein n=1 Tax=Tetragenococcus koreensis TaxID=290335 RepID=UPI001F20AD71
NDEKITPKTDDIEIWLAVPGTARYIIPESMLGHEGKVTGYVYLEFSDGSHTDEGRFTFEIKQSMITDMLPEAGDKYVKDFEDIKAEVQEAADGAKETISQKVTEVSDTSDSAISKVNQAADDTIKTADQAQGDIQTSVSDVQSSQAGAEKDIAGLVESTESARDEAVKTMNELDYTDRNLIVTSKLSSAYNYSTPPVIEENGRKITITYKKNDTEFVGLKLDGWTPSGENYALSARIEINGDPVTWETFPGKKINYSHPDIDVERFDVLSDGTVIATERYYASSDNLILLTKFHGISKGDEIAFYDLQFQPGSVATPWQPSFGDYDAKIKKLEEAITNLGGSI